ncbi:hypothetical protein BH18ACT1_BH18ACT1_00970 [soil metagenome]
MFGNRKERAAGEGHVSKEPGGAFRDEGRRTGSSDFSGA